MLFCSLTISKEWFSMVHTAILSESEKKNKETVDPYLFLINFCIALQHQSIFENIYISVIMKSDI